MLERYPPEINHEGWPRLVRKVAANGGFALSDIDLIIFTQVRKPSIELVMADLGLPMERTHTVMEEWGYTGSACIPHGARRRVDEGQGHERATWWCSSARAWATTRPAPRSGCHDDGVAGAPWPVASWRARSPAAGNVRRGGEDRHDRGAGDRGDPRRAGRSARCCGCTCGRSTVYAWMGQGARCARSSSAEVTVDTPAGPAGGRWSAAAGPGAGAAARRRRPAGAWSRLAPEARRTLPLIVPDLAGHGDSEPRTGPIDVDRIVDGVERCIEQLARGPAGHDRRQLARGLGRDARRPPPPGAGGACRGGQRRRRSQGSNEARLGRCRRPAPRRVRRCAQTARCRQRRGPRLRARRHRPRGHARRRSPASPPPRAPWSSGRSTAGSPSSSRRSP